MTSSKSALTKVKLRQKNAYIVGTLSIETVILLIYGYIRQSYVSNGHKLNCHSVFLFTQPFNNIIFLYFYTEPRDEWDPKCISSRMKIDDQETDDMNDINEKEPKVTVTVYGACSAFLTNVVIHGRHEWKFRIEGTSGCWWFFIGIWKVNSGKMLLESWFNSNTPNNSYTYAANFVCLPNPAIPNKDAWGGYNRRKEYGETCKVGDIIDMRLDFNDLTLAYSINGKDLGIAYENIKQTKYRAVVGLCYKYDSIRLLSYKSS